MKLHKEALTLSEVINILENWKPKNPEPPKDWAELVNITYELIGIYNGDFHETFQALYTAYRDEEMWHSIESEETLVYRIWAAIHYASENKCH